MSNLNKNTFGHSVLSLINKYPEFFTLIGTLSLIAAMVFVAVSCGRNKQQEKMQICEKISDQYVKGQCFLAIVSKK